MGECFIRASFRSSVASENIHGIPLMPVSVKGAGEIGLEEDFAIAALVVKGDYLIGTAGEEGVGAVEGAVG